MEPIVDAWIQHPFRRFMADPIFASLRRWIRSGEEIPDVPVEMTIGALDAAGVRQALITAWYGPRGAMISNDDVAEAVAQYPDRLVGVASVDLQHPMEAVRELRRCVKDLGMRALRLLPWIWGLPPDDRLYYPLFAECIDIGIPFCLQVGQTGPLCPSEPGRPIPYLERVALDFPELVIVGGHIGHPWTQEMILLARKFPNVYIDTSAYKIRRFPSDFVDFLRGDGRKKVMFGSNYPMIMPGDSLADLDSLELDPEARRMFLFENAARVFGLSSARP